MLSKDYSERQSKSKVQYEVEFDAKDPTGMVKEINRKTKTALTHAKKWRAAAREDFKFALGDQWTSEEREILKEQARPCLTFNKIEALIDLVGGWQRENALRIRIFPEGGEDKTFSEIGDKCLKTIDKWTKLNYKLDHMFDDALICGKGWIEMGISYDDDPILGDLIFRNCTVYQVLPDPNGIEYDRSDWEHIIKIAKYTKNQLKKMFPDAESEIEELVEDNSDYFDTEEAVKVIKGGDDDNYHIGKEDRELTDITSVKGGVDQDDDEQFTLKEYWHRKNIKKFFVYNVNSGEPEEFDKKKDAEARRDQIIQEFQAQNQQAMQEFQKVKEISMEAQMAIGQPGPMPQPPAPQEIDVQVVERYVRQMWYAAEVAGVLVQKDSRSPFSPHYEDFPIFPFYAKQYVSALDEELAVKGVTRNIIDAQKDYNKAKSQYLHVINTSANSGWIGDSNALSDEEKKDLKMMGSTPGICVWKKPGTDLQRITPTGPDMAHMIREEKDSEDIKQISGINSDAMAIQDKTTSGRAISMRIKQAMTILSKYFRNFRFTKEMIGTAIYAMLPSIFDVNYLRKVLGTQWMQVNQVDDSMLHAFLQQVEDGKFDMAITEADNSLTVRQETFEELMDLAKAGYPIPPDVILEFSSMPNSKEIIDKVKASMQAQAEAAQSKGTPAAPQAPAV